MVATAPAAPAATVRSSLTVILAAEAVTAGAPTMGLVGEPGVEETVAAEATRIATPPALHVAASTPARRSKNFGTRSLLTVNSCIKVRLDLQADKSPVVVKGPFFPRVVNPRYRIRGTMCNARNQSSK
jgi:hypothetical protein